MRPGLRTFAHRHASRPPLRRLVALGASSLALLLLLAAFAPTAARADWVEDLLTQIGAPHQIGSSDTDPLLDKLREKQVLTDEEWKEVKDSIDNEKAFSVKVGGQLQPRVVLYRGDDYTKNVKEIPQEFQGIPGDPNVHPGFWLRRARLNAGGQAYWPWLRYFVQIDLVDKTAPYDFQTSVIDANIDIVDLVPYHDIELGLAKPPFARQHLCSSSKLQIQERSIVVQELNDQWIDREMGLSVWGKIPVLEDALLIKYGAGVFNGGGVGTIVGDENVGKLFTGRGQLDLFRDLGNVEADLGRGGFGVSVGGGYFKNWDVGQEPWGWTADAEMMWWGFSLTGAYMEIKANPDTTGDVASPDANTIERTTKGWYVQGGAMLYPRLLELVGRYEQYEDTQYEGRVTSYTAGANLYLSDNNLKMSLDYVGRPDDWNLDIQNDSLTLEVQLLF